MTPNDIKVGQKYGHRDYPESKWLGVGKRVPFTYGATREYSEKHLALIQNENDADLGLIFKTVDDDFGAWQSDWDSFYEIN